MHIGWNFYSKGSLHVSFVVKACSFNDCSSLHLNVYSMCTFFCIHFQYNYHTRNFYLTEDSCWSSSCLRVRIEWRHAVPWGTYASWSDQLQCVMFPPMYSHALCTHNIASIIMHSCWSLDHPFMLEYQITLIRYSSMNVQECPTGTHNKSTLHNYIHIYISQDSILA